MPPPGPDEARGPERREPSGQSLDDQACNHTILVVDDEPALLELTRRILHREGYRVLTARGGRIAVDLVQVTDGPIDLLITDLVMPDMSGRDVARRVGELAPATKVVYLSGYGPAASDGTDAVGVDVVHVGKPFTADELLRAVREVLAP